MPQTYTFDSYYMSIDDSIDTMESLLNFQFNFVFDNKLNFLRDVYIVLDKSHKYNCLQIVGPPTSFKSTFINSIASFMLNTGTVTKVRIQRSLHDNHGCRRHFLY